LRFNSADSTYLNRTFSTATNRKIWTLSFWTKRTNVSSAQQIFASRPTSSPYGLIYFTASNDLQYDDNGSMSFATSQVFRDTAAWYHIVIALDTTQATNTNRIKVYVNGSQVTAFSSISYPTLNYDPQINSASNHTIGKGGDYTAEVYNGYMAEVHFVDGTALTPSSFGLFDNRFGGIWVPKTVSGVTYGTNGFYLPFSDNTSTTTLGNDGTANNNDWTLNNFSVTAGAGNDSLLDTPTNNGVDDGSGADVKGNYAVLNSLGTDGGTYSNGNLDWLSPATDQRIALSSIAVTSNGKWYFETTMGSKTAAYWHLGVFSYSTTWDPRVAYRSDGGRWIDSSQQSGDWASYTQGDIIGVAFDSSNGNTSFYKNGTYQGSMTTGAAAVGRDMHFGVTSDGSGGTANYSVNFGQRPFAYTAPTGYKTLNTHNLTPGIAANSSTTLANNYYQAIAYTGDGTSPRSFTNLNFRPDLVWIKTRSGADSTFYHRFASSLMPDNNYMSPHDTDGLQNALNGYIDSFDSNGFTVVPGGGGTNASGSTYCAWCWSAGGSTVTNTSGTITSSVRANQVAGFSVLTYTGTGAGGGSVGHGLGKTPAFIITKRHDTGGWVCWHKSISGGSSSAYIYLDLDLASGTTSNYWNGSGTGINSSTFGVWATGGDNNNSGSTISGIVWAEIEGYS
jgi:hypothetical protein